MKSVIFSRFGEPAEVLELRELEQPIPGAGEIVTRMAAAPINPSDLIPVRGAYRHRTPLPGVPGYEGVGVVVARGEGANVAIGQRVLPLRGAGTWQQYVRSPAACAIAVPDSIPDGLACQLYINPLTAWLILHEALALDAGDVIVANAGGSAFASVLVQLTRRRGVRVVLLSSDPKRTARLLDLGAHAVLDAVRGDLQSRVLALTGGRRAAAVLDAVGGAEGAALAHCIAPGGSFIFYGLLSGVPLALSAREVDALGIRLRGFWLRHWLEHTTPERFQAAFRQIISVVMEGDVALPEVACSYPLDHVREAVLAAEQRGRAGKVLLAG